jgi:hypothetical protein
MPSPSAPAADSAPTRQGATILWAAMAFAILVTTALGAYVAVSGPPEGSGQDLARFLFPLVFGFSLIAVTASRLAPVIVKGTGPKVAYNRAFLAFAACESACFFGIIALFVTHDLRLVAPIGGVFFAFVLLFPTASRWDRYLGG